MSEERTRSDEVTTGMGDEMQDWRVRALNVLLVAVSLVATVVSLNAVILAIRDPRWWPRAAPVLVAYLFILALTVLRRLDARLRAWGLLVVGYAVGILSMALYGLLGSGPIFLLALPALGVILIGFRSGLIMAVTSLAIYAAFGVAAALGWMQGWLVVTENSLELSQWLSQGSSFVCLLAALVLTQSALSRAQARTLARAREAAAALAADRDLLQTRTDQLDHHTTMLEAACHISRDITPLPEGAYGGGAPVLLQEVVDLIANRLCFEQVAIYLVDESAPGEIALGATSRRSGRLPPPGKRHSAEAEVPAAVERMLTTSEGASGGGAPSGSRMDVAETAASPALNDELVLLLQADRQIVGALDVWCAESTSFRSQDVATLHLLAGQVAVVIQNARLFSATQASLRELDALLRRQTAESWKGLPAYGPAAIAHHFGSKEVPDETWRPLFKRARTQGAPATDLARGADGRHLLAVPVKLREIPIGVLGFQRPASTGPWRVDEIAAIETVADRLALAVENARLLEGVQRRAAREQLASQVMARTRESLDMDTVLRTAAQEVRRVMGLPEVVIRLRHRPDDEFQGNVG